MFNRFAVTEQRQYLIHSHRQNGWLNNELLTGRRLAPNGKQATDTLTLAFV